MLRRSALVLLVLSLATSVYGLTGPANGGYIWLTENDRNIAWDYVDIQVKALYVDNTLQGVAGTFQVFTPMVPDNYIQIGQSSHAAGELCGVPTVCRNSTLDGYGRLYVGAYADETPAGTTSRTMDVMRIDPQAGGTLTITNVYGGKADTSGFHTEDATQVHYDRWGHWCGTDNSLVVTGQLGRMASRTDGYLTDGNGDGDFTDGADSETYLGCADMPGKTVLYKNCLYGQSGWIGSRNGSNGYFQNVRNGGTITSTIYYEDDTGSLEVHTAGATEGPGFAVRDTNGNDIPDVYVPLYNIYFDHDCDAGTPDVYAYGVAHLEDLNLDGDALDDGEHTVFWISGRQAYVQAPFDPDNEVWQTSGRTIPFAVVEGWDGTFALLCHTPGHVDYGTTYFALGIDADGNFSGEASVIATETGPGGEPWPFLGADLDSQYMVWDRLDVVPEPGTLLLLSCGALGLAGRRRRKT